MRLLSIRLIVSLIVGITLVSLSSSYYEVLGEKRGLRRDLERRAEVLVGVAGQLLAPVYSLAWVAALLLNVGVAILPDDPPEAGLVADRA
jgi:hypothetical protein